MAQVKGEGKTDFVKAVLRKDPHANVKAVNEAWHGEGREGAISESLVQRIRSELKLTGNIRRTKSSRGGRTAGATRRTSTRPRVSGRAGASAASGTNGVDTPRSVRPSSATRSEGRLLEELETGLDHLIFKVLDHGELSEIADGLRRVRRLVARRQEA